MNLGQYFFYTFLGILLLVAVETQEFLLKTIFSLSKVPFMIRYKVLHDMVNIYQD